MWNFEQCLAAELATLNETHARTHVLQLTPVLDRISDLADGFKEYSHSDSSGSYVVSSGILVDRVLQVIMANWMLLIK